MKFPLPLKITISASAVSVALATALPVTATAAATVTVMTVRQHLQLAKLLHILSDYAAVVLAVLAVARCTLPVHVERQRRSLA